MTSNRTRNKVSLAPLGPSHLCALWNPKRTFPGPDDRMSGKNYLRWTWMILVSLVGLEVLAILLLGKRNTERLQEGSASAV